MTTALSLTEILAQRLHQALLEQPVLTIEDIYGHGAVQGLHPETVGTVIDALTSTGRLTDDEHGRLVITPIAIPEAA